MTLRPNLPLEPSLPPPLRPPDTEAPDTAPESTPEFAGPTRRDTIGIVVLTLAADTCLYVAPGGTGAGVLLVTMLLGIVVLGWQYRSRISVGLTAIVVLTAAASVWHYWWLQSVVGWTALVALSVRLYRPDWRITEVVWALPQTVVRAPLRLFRHLRRPRRARDPEPEPATPATPRRRVAPATILAPVLVCIVFALIFAAANPVVARLGRDALDMLRHWLTELLEYLNLFRWFTWLCWLLAFAGLLHPAMRSRVADRLAKRRESLAEPPEGPPSSDFATALATLIAVNVMFLAFNVLDSVYLYFKVGLPEGITYSQYAHRGCFWLTLALALSTFMIGAVFRGRLNFHAQAGRLRSLAYVWAALNAFLAVGALRRLQMYVAYNGLTRARILGVYGILLVVAGLALMVWKVYRTRGFLWLLRRDLLAFWIALALLAMTPRDWLCWQWNVARIRGGNPRPLALLHGQPLPPAAWPALIPLLDYADPDNPVEARLVRDGVAGLLGREYVTMPDPAKLRWSARQVSRTWARRHLEAVRPRLDTEAPTREDTLREYTRKWW